MVLNKDRTKLLMIQEQNPLLPDVWKLPGGLVETGETIEEAVLREVWEETGVKCKFKGIQAFRELKSFMFGQQDFYFVCLLETDDEHIEIQMTHEIAKCQWIRIDKLTDYKFTKLASILLEIIEKGIKPVTGLTLDNLFEGTQL